MPEEIITYEVLYDILRRERIKQELQKLDQILFNDINKYVREKKSILDDLKAKSSIFAQKEVEKTEKQLINIKKIVKEIYDKRESKITQLALIAAKTTKIQDESNLLPEERLLFENLVKFLKNYRDDILNRLLEEDLKPKVIKSDQESIKLVRITQPIPKFIGDDLNEYGPFEEEYIASLPIRIAELLIKNNRAEEL